MLFAEKANILLKCLNGSIVCEMESLNLLVLFAVGILSMCRQRVFWVPKFEKNLDHLERVQRREMQMIRV